MVRRFWVGLALVALVICTSGFYRGHYGTTRYAGKSKAYQARAFYVPNKAWNPAPGGDVYCVVLSGSAGYSGGKVNCVDMALSAGATATVTWKVVNAATQAAIGTPKVAGPGNPVSTVAGVTVSSGTVIDIYYTTATDTPGFLDVTDWQLMLDNWTVTESLVVLDPVWPANP